MRARGDANALTEALLQKDELEYEEIDAITDFMDWCDSQDPADEQNATNFYRFVRVGEETDDNVIRGYGFEDVYIERSITF